ncbi:MAG TPA: cytochrome P450, partial [Acidimicrobiia bacterium]|nr:cytochrome P450 [Acidimicrobiia bacterium]
MVGFNPYSYEFHEDPFTVYRRLRDEAPAYYNEELNFWALSRYDDVLAALHDPERFCSKYGITIEDGNPLPMMLTTDPPDHTGLRRLVSRAFTPRRIADLEPNIRKLST